MDVSIWIWIVKVYEKVANLAASSSMRHWPPVPLVPGEKGRKTKLSSMSGCHGRMAQSDVQNTPRFYTLIAFDKHMCKKMRFIRVTREAHCV